jgi:hypothetical protein
MSSSLPSTCWSPSRSSFASAASSASPRRKPGPKGPSPELIAAIVALKRRNPHFGCVRIAQQITQALGVEIDKDVVRRVLARHTGQATLAPPARPG